jgi:cystathionine beta-lyase
VLPLWVADMDFGCAPSIIEALHKRVDRRIFGYNHSGSEEYYNSVINWFKRRFGWEVPRESICYSPGIVPAIGFLVKVLTNKGDGVIIQRPVYYPFTSKIEANDRTVINNPLLYQDGKYKIDFEDLEEKLRDDNNKVLILCSPHNPVGRVWNSEELKKVINLCSKYDKYIISDEIHFDIIRKDVSHTVLETVDSSYKNKIITCTAPSKTFNLAGMQISNIIIHDKEIRKKWLIETHEKCGIHLPNSFAQVATVAAYNQSEDWLNQVNEYIDENISYVKSFVEENMPKARFIDPEGTYLVWIDLNGYGLSDKKIHDAILKNAKVALDDGFIFGKEGMGFQRINVACPRSILVKCMEKIKIALDNC